LSLYSTITVGCDFLRTIYLHTDNPMTLQKHYVNNTFTSIFLIFLCICFAEVPPSQATEGRFTKLENGAIKDGKSGLIWAPQDNGASIIWSQAIIYCENYSLGGHNDWRIPTSDELATLYGNTPKIKGNDYQQTIDVATPLITITAPWVWTAKRGPKNKAIAFGFNYGTTRRLHRGSGGNRRALPVRSAP